METLTPQSSIHFGYLVAVLVYALAALFAFAFIASRHNEGRRLWFIASTLVSFFLLLATPAWQAYLILILAPYEPHAGLLLFALITSSLHVAASIFVGALASRLFASIGFRNFASRRRIVLATAVVLLSVIVTGLLTRSTAMTTDELQAYIDTHLSPGDSAEQIEQFLDENKWPYTYDRFSQRYQTGYPDGEVDTWYRKKAIAIYIYVNESKEYERAVVRAVYTGI